MRNLRTIVIAGGVGLIAYAIYRYYALQFSFVKNVDYRISKIKINQITKSLISIDITMRVANYSNVNAVIKEMYLDLYINDIKVGDVQESKDIQIKSQDYTDVAFTFNIQPQLILKNVTQIFNISLALKDATVVAKGFAKLESGVIKATVPYEYKTTFKEYLNIK